MTFLIYRIRNLHAMKGHTIVGIYVDTIVGIDFDTIFIHHFASFEHIGARRQHQGFDRTSVFGRLSRWR